MDAFGKLPPSPGSGYLSTGHTKVSTCLLACLLCASMSLVVGEWTRRCPTETSIRYNARGSCGTKLADTVAMLCRIYGGYHSHSYGKRSDNSIQDAEYQHETPTKHHDESSQYDLVQPNEMDIVSSNAIDENDDDDEDSPFWSKSQAYSFVKVKKRRIINDNGQSYRQGIVCECCMHQCRLSELKEYCADPSYSIGKRQSIGNRLGKHGLLSRAFSTKSLISALVAAPSDTTAKAIRVANKTSRHHHYRKHHKHHRVPPASGQLEGEPTEQGPHWRATEHNRRAATDYLDESSVIKKHLATSDNLLEQIIRLSIHEGQREAENGLGETQTEDIRNKK